MKPSKITKNKKAVYVPDPDLPPVEEDFRKTFSWRIFRIMAEFIEGDFLGKQIGAFDAVVSLDVVEHIPSEVEADFFTTIRLNLNDDGIAIIGTPNKYANKYASPASKAGHINIFDAQRLRSTLEKDFHNVFLFSMNDDVVHTGFASMAHYLLSLACNRKMEKSNG